MALNFEEHWNVIENPDRPTGSLLPTPCLLSGRQSPIPASSPRPFLDRMTVLEETISCRVANFISWFKANGGQIHPHAQFKPGEWGLSVVAGQPLPRDVKLLTCPFSLIITPDLSRTALSSLGLDLLGWSEKQLICSYIVTHWIFDEAELPPPFSHKPYLSVMPHPTCLRTSLHFTTDEIEALRGTNLYPATLDRRNAIQTDWTQCRSAFQLVDPALASAFTWEHYLTASTYLASRAFPSSILSANPTLISSPSSHPVLLPGIDSLNHARGQPVTWLVSYPDEFTEMERDPSVSLVLHTDAKIGDELFNNYGPKPNSELILAYGFTLLENPDDTIVLQIGGHGQPGKKWEVGRNARGFDVVWDGVREIVAGQSDDGDEPSYEGDLDAADMLLEMLGTLFDRLPQTSRDPHDGIRPEVATLIDHYVEGQTSILKSTIEFTESTKQKAIETAKEQGIELVFDE